MKMGATRLAHETSTIRVGPGFARQAKKVFRAATSARESPAAPILFKILISVTLPCGSTVSRYAPLPLILMMLCSFGKTGRGKYVKICLRSDSDWTMT